MTQEEVQYETKAVENLLSPLSLVIGRMWGWNPLPRAQHPLPNTYTHSSHSWDFLPESPRMQQGVQPALWSTYIYLMTLVCRKEHGLFVPRL